METSRFNGLPSRLLRFDTQLMEKAVETAFVAIGDVSARPKGRSYGEGTG